MATKFKPQERVIFAQSTKIGTHEYKAIHSQMCLWNMNAPESDQYLAIFV